MGSSASIRGLVVHHSLVLHLTGRSFSKVCFLVVLHKRLSREMIVENFYLVVHHTLVLHLLGAHFSKDIFQRATALLTQQILKCQLYIDVT